MNMIKIPSVYLGLFRHVLTALAGWLAYKGYVSQDIANQILGLGLALLGGGWSISDKLGNVATLTELIAELDKQTNPPPPVVESATELSKGRFLSERSKTNLIGVHPDLIRVVEAAIIAAPYDFTVVEGLRSLERQKNLYDARPKKTWTMNSKHLAQADGTGHAVDLYIFNGREIDNDLGKYSALNDHIQETAQRLGVFNLEWGGEWKVRDGVHWQINL